MPACEAHDCRGAASRRVGGSPSARGGTRVRRAAAPIEVHCRMASVGTVSPVDERGRSADHAPVADDDPTEPMKRVAVSTPQRSAPPLGRARGGLAPRDLHLVGSLQQAYFTVAAAFPGVAAFPVVAVGANACERFRISAAVAVSSDVRLTAKPSPTEATFALTPFRTNGQ